MIPQYPTYAYSDTRKPIYQSTAAHPRPASSNRRHVRRHPASIRQPVHHRPASIRLPVRHHCPAYSPLMHHPGRALRGRLCCNNWDFHRRHPCPQQQPGSSSPKRSAIEPEEEIASTRTGAATANDTKSTSDKKGLRGSMLDNSLLEEI